MIGEVVFSNPMDDVDPDEMDNAGEVKASRDEPLASRSGDSPGDESPVFTNPLNIPAGMSGDAVNEPGIRGTPDGEKKKSKKSKKSKKKKKKAAEIVPDEESAHWSAALMHDTPPGYTGVDLRATAEQMLEITKHTRAKFSPTDMFDQSAVGDGGPIVSNPR